VEKDREYFFIGLLRREKKTAAWCYVEDGYRGGGGGREFWRERRRVCLEKFITNAYFPYHDVSPGWKGNSENTSSSYAAARSLLQVAARLSSTSPIIILVAGEGFSLFLV